MIRTGGVIYETVKKLLSEKGLNTDNLQVVSFGRGNVYHDIFLNGEHIGDYQHRGKHLMLLEPKK